MRESLADGKFFLRGNVLGHAKKKLTNLHGYLCIRMQT